MKEFFDVEKLNGISDVKVISGDYDKKPAEILSKVAPMGKVAFISFFDTHEKYAKTLISSVLNEGIKVISLIMPEPVKYTVEYASHAFNLPEDVRAVMVIDRMLYNIAAYFAKIKDLPLIYIPDSACVSGVLGKTFYLKNGDKYEKTPAAKNVYVILDDRIIDKEIAEGYAFNMARLTTLIDYRVVKTSDDKLDSAYYTMLEGVTDTYSVLSEEKPARASYLLFNGLKIVLADRLDGFTFIDSSAERVAARINYGDVVPPVSAEFFFSLKLMELYFAAFGIKKACETFPSYLNRSEKVRAAMDIAQGAADDALLNNIKAAKKDLKKAIRAMNALKNEIGELLTHQGVIKSTFYALGGKDVPIDCGALKYAGDTFFGVNAMSFLRETGATD